MKATEQRRKKEKIKNEDKSDLASSNEVLVGREKKRR